MRLVLLLVCIVSTLGSDPPVTPTDQKGKNPEPIKTFLYEVTQGNHIDLIHSFQLVFLYLYNPNECTVCEGQIRELEATAKNLGQLNEWVAIGWVNMANSYNDKLVAKVGATNASPTMVSYRWWNDTKPFLFTGTTSQEEFTGYFLRALHQLSPYVPVLDATTAREVISSETVMIVIHCGRTQGVCEDFYPDINEASHELFGQPAGVALLPVGADERWASQFFPPQSELQNAEPTLGLVVGGAPSFIIRHSPNALNMVHTLYLHLNKGVSPEFTNLESGDALDKVLEEHTVLVLFVQETTPDGSAYQEEMQWFKLFEIFAFQNNEICRFALARNVPEINNRVGIQGAGFVMMKTFDTPTLPYQGALNTYSFREWVKENFFPTVSDFEPLLYPAFVLRAMPVIYLFCDPHAREQDEVNYVRFGVAAQMFHSVASFVHVNITKYPATLPQLGITAEELPAIVVEKPPLVSDIVDEEGKPQGVTFRGIMSLHASNGHNFDTGYYQELLAKYEDKTLFDEEQQDITQDELPPS